MALVLKARTTTTDISAIPSVSDILTLNAVSPVREDYMSHYRAISISPQTGTVVERHTFRLSSSVKEQMLDEEIYLSPVSI